MAATNVQGTPAKGLLLTPAQIANLPPDQQAAYMKSLTPQEQALVNAEARNQKVAANRAFLRKSIERIAYCPVSGGSGTTATYAQGSTLVFDLPTVGGGYAKALLITYNLTLNLGVGTSAVYAASDAAPFNIFQELQVVYNGAQVRTHPYFLKILDQIQGYAKYIPQDGVPGGFTHNTTIDAQLGFTSTETPNLPVTTGSNQTWQGKILLRLNALADDAVPGLLPVMGVGNKPQLKLICAAAFVGVDPLLNPLALASGTAGTNTFTGNVNVDMIYADGTVLSDPNGVALDLTTEPTLQYYWDTPLNPLSANLLMRQHIATLLEHWVVASVVIDGQQLSHFATIANLTALQLSADSVGQQNFYSYNVANNVSVYDYYERVRRKLGQDLDAGVIIWINAPMSGVVDPDNRNGIQALNMQPGGYPAATHAYQVSATGAVAGIVPRVETFLLSMNYNGLKLT